VLDIPPDTIIVTQKLGHQKKKTLLREKGVTFIEHEQDRADLAGLMKDLGKSGIMSVLIEGGSSLNASALESGIVDKVMFFISPKIIGGTGLFPPVGGRSFRRLPNAYRITRTTIKKIGDDFLISGYVVE
jgi:diaminohydroxyphosphoribosylaminopyrimidine deaminase/5-amino-6-(5-phosphoribosylamino)uracil reductase